MSDKNTPFCDFSYPEEETFWDALDRECAKRGWKSLKLLDLAKAVNAMKVENPNGPKRNQKLTYRGHGTHCGTQHRKKNFK